MPTPSIRRRLGVVTLLCTLLVAASACADRSSGGSGGGDDMTLNVGQISNSVAFFPLHVAEEEGFFEDEGLTLGERPRLGTGAKLSAALLGGSIDVAAGVMTDPLSLATTAREPKLVANLVNEYYVDVIVGNDFAGAPADADLNTKIEALKGKKIGITGPGSGTEALIVYLFDQVGLDPATDAELVNLGAQASSAIGALKSGQVDALSFFQPIGQAVEAQDVGSIYISPTRGDIPAMAGQTHGVAFTTTQVLENKRAAIEAFTRAIGKAEALIHDDPAKSKELFVAYQDALDPATVDALMPVLEAEVPTEPTFTEEGYQKAADFHTSSGLLEDAPSFEEITIQEE